MENPFLNSNFEPWKIKVRDQLGIKAILLHNVDTDRIGESYFVGEPSVSLFYVCCCDDGNRQFCIAPSSGFFSRLILDDELTRKVVRESPEGLGTGNAEDVLCALWKQDPNHHYFEYANFRKMAEHEQYAWIVEFNEDGVVGDKYLRLDLFRHIDENNKFQGGLLHVLKHFSYCKIPLSHDKSNDNISSTHYILKTIIEAFFMAPLKEDNSREKVQYISIVPHKAYNLKAVFFRNEDAGVYFVNSIYIQKKK